MKLIAEMCQNHNGDFNILLEMVAKASESGATHCKIQGLYSEELVYREEFEVDGSSVLVRPFAEERQRLAELDLSESQEKEFVAACRDYGVTPMITVFTHMGAERARRLEFSSIKIASYDCRSVHLLDRVSSFASELVISSGATSVSDVLASFKRTQKYKLKAQPDFLHAVTEYPTSLARLGVGKYLLLKDHIGSLGWSDHTLFASTGNLATKFFIGLGATVIERHFTILDSNQSKDGPVSVTPEGLREIRNFFEEPLNVKTQFAKHFLEEHPQDQNQANGELSKTELTNASYYRGRVASKHPLKGNVFGWEPWD